MRLAPLDLLGIVTVLVSVGPVIAGGVKMPTLPKGLQVFWGWMLLTFGLNVIVLTTAFTGHQTRLIVQFSFPVFAAVGLCAIGLLVESRLLRWWVWTSIPLYVAWWAWRISNGDHLHGFAVFTGPVLWFLLTLAAAVLLGDRMRAQMAKPLTDPLVLLGLGILISNAPGAAIEPVSLDLFEWNATLTRSLWVGRAVLMIIGSILFTLAFLWTTPPRSLSGSSSSVAPPPAS